MSILLFTLLSIWIAYIEAYEEDYDTSITLNDVSMDSNDSSDDANIFSTDYDSESADSDSCEEEDAEWDVDYVGKSTQFRIYNRCDDEQFLKMQMSDLTEYDLNGNRTINRVNGFAATDWQWVNRNGFNSRYDGYHVVQNTFKASNVINSADFTLTTFLFKQDAVINRNHTRIPRNGLKWNVNITNWPLLSDTNHLELCINLVTNRANESASESDDDSDEDSDSDEQMVHYWRAGDFDVGVFDSAECGSDEMITVTVREEGNMERNEKNLCFVFAPCSSGNIFYDPIITHVPSRLPSDGQLITSISRAVLIAVVGALGCVIIVASICYIYKQKKQGPYEGLLETQLT